MKYAMDIRYNDANTHELKCDYQVGVLAYIILVVNWVNYDGFFLDRIIHG